METTILSIILILVLFIILKLVVKDEFKLAKLVSGDYALNRRLKELLFERSVYAVVATDLYGNILMWNERSEKKFGYKEHEMIGKNIRMIIPERFRPLHDAAMKQYIETGESMIVNNDEGIEVIGLHRNGSEFPVHLKLISIDDHGFKTIGGFLRNITKEKEREAVLMASLELLSQGEKCANVATWNWNLLTRKVIVTDNFYHIFDIDKNRIVTSDMLMDYVYHEDRNQTAAIITQAIDNKEDYKTRYRRLLEDGSLRLIEIRGCLIFDEDNEVISIIGTIQTVEDGLGAT
jgi:PAS domain S-box-containing protein